MRHRRRTAKLGREASHRKAMIANMVSSLFTHEQVRTTDARGRVLRRTAEHMITFAKRGDLHARRQVLRHIPDKSIVARLFEEIAPRYAERHGGYTRLVKTGTRRGDGAEMCIVELLDRPGADSPPVVSEEPAEKEE